YNTPTEDETYDVVCYSGKSSEDLVFEFPKELKIISIPDNLELANDTLSYSAKYDLQGNILKVNRVFDDKTKGNVCSAKTMKDYDDFIKKVKPNYDDQVIYSFLFLNKFTFIHLYKSYFTSLTQSSSHAHLVCDPMTKKIYVQLL
ncbi:MAG: hypothetical protein V4440_00015, partial [Pseudomonadota bacterium]